MFGSGSLDSGTLSALGVVLLAVGAAGRLAWARGVDPFPVPVALGLAVSAVGPFDVLRPDPATTRAGAEIALILLLFCLGSDHSAADRRVAAAALPTGRLLAVDGALNALPGALFGLLAGFGPTGAALLGGVTGASSWAMSWRTLDRGGRFGNRETEAVLAVVVLEHAAVAFYLPLAAALLAPGDPMSRVTAFLGSAAVVAFATWLLLGPAPLLHIGPLGDPSSALGVALLTGAVLILAGVAAAIGVATAGVAYLAGAVLATMVPGLRNGDGAAPRPLVALRDLSGAAAGLALGLLVPARHLPGAVAGGFALAILAGAGKVATGWWASGHLLSSPSERGAVRSRVVGRPGRLRAGVTLVPRGELAVAVGLLAALSAPDTGPGTGLAALAAVLVVLTATAPALVRNGTAAGWYRWAAPAPAAVRRPDPSGAA